jgi:hypothetical protein
MPEVAINKNQNTGAMKNDVGTAGKIARDAKSQS